VHHRAKTSSEYAQFVGLTSCCCRHCAPKMH